jgi:hypothetical protein
MTNPKPQPAPPAWPFKDSWGPDGQRIVRKAPARPKQAKRSYPEGQPCPF